MNFFQRRPTEPTHIDVPAGCVRLRQELADLVIEARKTKRPVRLYLVNQSGYLNEFFITSRSRLEKPKKDDTGFCSGPSFYEVKGFQRSTFGSQKHARDRYYRSHILAGSYNIEANGGAFHHRAFTNGKLARQYSELLKNDRVYMQYVKDWHSYCSRTFGDIGA